jgi:hypothetical protein
MSIGMHVGQEVIKSAADLDGVESPRRELDAAGHSCRRGEQRCILSRVCQCFCETQEVQWSFINVRGRHALLDDSLPDYP